MTPEQFQQLIETIHGVSFAISGASIAICFGLFGVIISNRKNHSTIENADKLKTGIYPPHHNKY